MIEARVPSSIATAFGVVVVACDYVCVEESGPYEIDYY